VIRGAAFVVDDVQRRLKTGRYTMLKQNSNKFKLSIATAAFEEFQKVKQRFKTE
jgi:hypothetical protein